MLWDSYYLGKNYIHIDRNLNYLMYTYNACETCSSILIMSFSQDIYVILRYLINIKNF